MRRLIKWQVPIEAKNSWNSCALHKPVRRRFLYICIDDVRARECFELISMETRQIKGHLRHLFLLLSRPMMCSLFSLQRQWPMILFSFCCGWWCARTYICIFYFILLIPNGETRYSLNAGFFSAARRWNSAAATSKTLYTSCSRSRLFFS